MLHEWTYFMDRWVKSPVQSPWEDSCVTQGLGGPPHGGGGLRSLFLGLRIGSMHQRSMPELSQYRSVFSPGGIN